MNTSLCARSRPPCRSRSWQSIPTPALDTPMVFPMASTIVAEGVWCLTSGLYETGKFHPSLQGCFASHIHVLYRKVPFILNITACPEVRHHITLAVDRSDFHVPWVLYSHKPMTGLRSRLRELDLVRQQWFSYRFHFRTINHQYP